MIDWLHTALFGMLALQGIGSLFAGKALLEIMARISNLVEQLERHRER